MQKNSKTNIEKGEKENNGNIAIHLYTATEKKTAVLIFSFSNTYGVWKVEALRLWHTPMMWLFW